MAYMRIYVSLLLLTTPLHGGTLTQREAESFAESLVHRDRSLDSWFDRKTLAISHRLGISYEGVPFKPLIGYDIDDSTRDAVLNGHARLSVSIDSLGDGFSRVVTAAGGSALQREFYFEGTKCISPLSYLARGWSVRESKHFRFFVSDPALFNEYCVRTLEAFLVRTGGDLGLSERDLHLLAAQKIYYYLCSTEEEVRQLTGFQARGMYNLAYDAVISTYGAHEHELTHLLVNYRLHHLPLYTHPLLQEGLAVAMGGRGGMDAAVLMTLGGFLYRSEAVDLKSLLDRGEFLQLDPSMSYPAAGLYNQFLYSRLGAGKYLALYRAHSGSPDSPAVLRIGPGELPDSGEWMSFLERSVEMQSIGLEPGPATARTVCANGVSTVTRNGERYYFRLHDHMLLQGGASMQGYRSSLFRQLYPAELYNGEEYLVRADSQEVSIYNLWTNSLIAHYSASFALPPASVPRRGDDYQFSVRTGVFTQLFRRPGKSRTCSLRCQ
jgi:hypothetical protein